MLTPAYPGFEVEVEALREDPSPIEALSFPAIIEHIGSIIDELDSGRRSLKDTQQRAECSPRSS